MEWIFEPQEEATDENLFACTCGGSATIDCSYWKAPTNI